VVQAAPHGGLLLAGARRAAEHLLWTRVAFRGAVESRTSPDRQVPGSVAPTGVLANRAEWEAAVAECRRLRLPLHHDRPRNWDALGAVGAVLSRAGHQARVLDAGSARYSVVLPWLRLYGVRDLVGINLEFGPEVRRGPVTYRYGDETATDFPAESLDAVTCLSVIEHGVSVKAFLEEAARILRPGGVLCLSTDYDQQPPDTAGLFAYGAPVKIFGPDDIRELVSHAEGFGLRLQGELALGHPERAVHRRRTGLDHTFVLLTFVRA